MNFRIYVFNFVYLQLSKNIQDLNSFSLFPTTLEKHQRQVDENKKVLCR